MKTYPIEQALQAQKALRDAAGLGPEMFPIEAFVGMVSDEIEQLRAQGKTDGEIAKVIMQNSANQDHAGRNLSELCTPRGSPSAR